MRLRTRLTLRRTLRRLALIILLPLTLLLALRLLWGWEAAHRLARTRADLLAAGIRLNPPAVSIPDDQNAALAVIEAIHALRLTSADRVLAFEGDSGYEFITNVNWPIGGLSRPDIAWTPVHEPEVRRILANNADVFRWLQIAATRQSAHWPTTAAGIFYTADHPIYYTLQLASLLHDAAIFAHRDHDDHEALESIRLILLLANIVDRDAAEMSHLYASAMRALAALTVERLEADLALSQRGGSLHSAHDLLLILLGEQSAQDARALAWEAEIKTTSTPESLRRDYPAYWQWWVRPMLSDIAARDMRERASEVPSVRCDNFVDTKSLLPAPTSLDSGESNLDEITISWGPVPGVSWGPALVHFRALSDTRAAALLLAARLYASEHAIPPAKAVDLVPEFLPSVPLDPFAPDHQPMHYRLDPAGPTVWSVSENGVDDGAPVTFDVGSTKTRRYGDGRHTLPDIVYGAAWRTATAPPRATMTSPMDPSGSPLPFVQPTTPAHEGPSSAPTPR